MRLPALMLACLLAAAALACCDDGGGEKDATGDQICTPGTLRCDPEGRPWIQQCNEDGTAWEDHVPCDHLCHEGICYPPLDGSSG
jgi:hypothetical protein